LPESNTPFLRTVMASRDRSSRLDELGQFLRRVDIAVEGQLLGLQVAAAAVPAPQVGHVPLGDGLVGGVVHALPLEEDDLAAEHDDGPGHRYSWLGDQRPPVQLALLLLLESVVRPVLAQVDEVVAVLGGEDVAAAAAQRLAVRRPPVLVLLLDLRQWET